MQSPFVLERLTFRPIRPILHDVLTLGCAAAVGHPVPPGAAVRPPDPPDVLQGIIGGDSNLAPRGEEYARLLPDVLIDRLPLVRWIQGSGMYRPQPCQLGSLSHAVRHIYLHPIRMSNHVPVVLVCRHLTMSPSRCQCGPPH